MSKTKKYKKIEYDKKDLKMSKTKKYKKIEYDKKKPKNVNV